MARFHDNSRPLLLSVPLGILAAITGSWALKLTWLADELLREMGDEGVALAQNGVIGLSQVLCAACGVAAAVLAAASLLGFVRRRWVVSLLRKAYVLVYVLFWLYAYAVTRVTGLRQGFAVALDPRMAPGPVEIFFERWDLVKWPLLAVAVVAFLHLLTWTRATLNLYRREDRRDPAPGDVFLENVRTHGKDPEGRKSWWHSINAHAMVLIIIPWLLQWIGCVENYRVPKGSGEPVVALVKMVQPKKPKPKKKLMLRPDAAVYFHMPDLDDSEIQKQVDQMSELVYKANPNAKAGKMGRGGGKTGGWPEGMDKGKVRFIRLEHNGIGWDDGMDAVARADLNFLDEFHRLTGFKVGTRPESHRIALLARYDKGFAPPFVYFTGEGRFSIGDRDAQILREYLFDGGMLFGDCGHPSFDRPFRDMVARVLPGHRLVPIADDDPIFQMPYAFPNGAPPLWHHGGTKALGVKYKGRWCVFYHPGDVNDAWKTGHSGMKPDMAEGAFNMGVNIVYYSFTQYLELTRKYRK